MNKRKLMNELEPILSGREIEVVLKRLNNKHITQTESNYLSRSIRPKLKSAEFAASAELLSLLDYRRKKYEREDNLLRTKLIKTAKSLIDINNLKAIVIFGSYIRNRHTNYRDIDVMIVLNKKIWKNLAGRYKLKLSLERTLDIKTDISLIEYNELKSLLPYSPLLQNELEEYNIIYGTLKLKKKIIIDRTHLRRKLLETEQVTELANSIDSRYIYNAIRNCLAIALFLKKVINNKLIIETIENNIGKITADSLMDNKANKIQRDIALRYLKYIMILEMENIMKLKRL